MVKQRRDMIVEPLKPKNVFKEEKRKQSTSSITKSFLSSGTDISADKLT